MHLNARACEMASLLRERESEREGRWCWVRQGARCAKRAVAGAAAVQSVGQSAGDAMFAHKRRAFFCQFLVNLTLFGFTLGPKCVCVCVSLIGVFVKFEYLVHILYILRQRWLCNSLC